MPRPALSNEVRELVAIGVSLATKCQPCVKYHMKEAIKLGVTDKEIEAVIKLTRQIRSVADQKIDEFIVNVLGEGDCQEIPSEKAENCSASGDGKTSMSCC